MITLGIDLAAEPKNTAACRIAWREDKAEVVALAVGQDDDMLLAGAAAADVVGIDAPFGWPDLFVKAISAHHAAGGWPIASWDAASRRRLRLRVTDEKVHSVTGKLTPLSVSADTIAIPATRCAGLLGRMGVSDRSGDGKVFEVYPAAALHVWGLLHRGYKGRANRAVLASSLDALGGAASWLEISAAARSLCAFDDNAFDALICALIARAAARGLTLRPTPQERALARVEGWIALPRADSLAALL